MKRQYRQRPSVYTERASVGLTRESMRELVRLAKRWRLPLAAATRRIIEERLKEEEDA